MLGGKGADRGYVHKYENCKGDFRAFADNLALLSISQIKLNLLSLISRRFFRERERENRVM